MARSLLSGWLPAPGAHAGAGAGATQTVIRPLLFGWLLVLGLLLGTVGVARATGATHVRVVLDVSKSMSARLGDGTGPNDPGRLAVLATMLLHDLVDPNPRRPERPDSFVVLPFKPDWPRWTDPALPPPTGTGAPIIATGQDAAAREAFWRALHELPYNGAWTYFYPGLRAALDSLLATGAGPDDRRVLVLLTDGLPEAEVKAREAQLLGELRRELLATGVQVYVLAFGPTASREQGFFDALFGGDGATLGGLFVDPGGRDLVANMTRIFAGGFGYMVEPLGAGPRERLLDLDGGVTPPKVALLGLRRGGPPPALDLTPAVAAARDLLTAAEQGGGYAVRLLEGVQPGAPYRLRTDADGVELAVLRKIETELGVLPGHLEQPGGRVAMDPGRPVRRVMAETPFVLRVLARSPTGSDGNQADLNISFRTHGPRVRGCESLWSEDYRAAVPGSRRRFGAGVTYDLRLRFPANVKEPGAVYRGYLEVIAGFRPAPGLPEQRVGELLCEQALELEVYPRLAIRPHPATATLSPASLGRGQRGCVPFTLNTDDPARLAVLGPGEVRLRASIAPTDPAQAGDAFAGAGYTLDGELVGGPGEVTPWQAGRALAPAALLGTHELCVTLGEPRLARATDDLALALSLVLQHPPYDDFPVVEPFTAKLRVIPIPLPGAGPFPWGALWALLLALLALLLALRALAPGQALPDDLRFSLVPMADDEPDLLPPGPAPGSSARWRPLPVPAWWQRLLGLSPARALRDGERVIAWLRPRRHELFALKPGREVRVTDAATGTLVPTGPGRLVLLQVQTDYLLRAAGGGRWRLRVGYVEEG